MRPPFTPDTRPARHTPETFRRSVRPRGAAAATPFHDSNTIHPDNL